MRIALISSSYFPYPGGVEEHTRNVARELVLLGHHVEVWTVDRGEHLGVQTVDEIVVRYLPTPLPARNLRSLTRFAASVAPAFRRWVSAFRSFRPEVLNVQCFGPNGLYAMALSCLTRTPLVVSSHGESFADDHNVFAESALQRRALAAAPHFSSRLTACSQVVAEDVEHRFGWHGTHVIPNGVDLDEPGRCGPIEAPYDATHPTFVAIGRAERVKGFDILIRAFAQAELPPDARLYIGGDGSQVAELSALAADLGAADRVELAGRVDRCTVVAAMANATAVVVPSRQEAFGIVVLEAWRSGRPLIASDVGGPRSLITDGRDGLLVGVEDVDALATALEHIQTHPEEAAAMARRGSKRVLEFSWARVGDGYEQLYRRSVGSSRRGKPKFGHVLRRSSPT